MYSRGVIPPTSELHPIDFHLIHPSPNHHPALSIPDNRLVDCQFLFSVDPSVPPNQPAHDLQHQHRHPRVWSVSPTQHNTLCTHAHTNESFFTCQHNDFCLSYRTSVPPVAFTTIFNTYFLCPAKSNTLNEPLTLPCHEYYRSFLQCLVTRWKYILYSVACLFYAFPLHSTFLSTLLASPPFPSSYPRFPNLCQQLHLEKSSPFVLLNHQSSGLAKTLGCTLPRRFHFSSIFNLTPFTFFTPSILTPLTPHPPQHTTSSQTTNAQGYDLFVSQHDGMPQRSFLRRSHP